MRECCRFEVKVSGWSIAAAVGASLQAVSQSIDALPARNKLHLKKLTLLILDTLCFHQFSEKYINDFTLFALHCPLPFELTSARPHSQFMVPLIDKYNMVALLILPFTTGIIFSVQISTKHPVLPFMNFPPFVSDMS